MMLNFTHKKLRASNRINAVVSRIDKTVIRGLPRVTALVIQNKKINNKQPKTWGFELNDSSICVLEALGLPSNLI